MSVMMNFEYVVELLTHFVSFSSTNVRLLERCFEDTSSSFLYSFPLMFTRLTAGNCGNCVRDIDFEG